MNPERMRELYEMMMARLGPKKSREQEIRDRIRQEAAVIDKAQMLQPTKPGVNPWHVQELIKQSEMGSGHDPLMATLAQFGPATIGRGPMALKAILNMLPDSVKKQMNVF